MRYFALLMAVWIFATVGVYVFAGRTAAWVMGYPGTALLLFGTILWAGVVDARRYWPDVPWWVRVSRVLTFYR